MDSLRAMLRLAGPGRRLAPTSTNWSRDRLVEVDDRTARLTALRGELSAMLSSGHHGTVGECRIVEVLSDHESCCTSEH